ncbi:MAG: TonB-dependent hemoglobin/transferrin/lactoferrin family receptor [Cellvibrionaceae bacterium]
MKTTPLALTLAIASTTSAAQTATPTFTLDKVTVAATLTEQKVADVANTVTVIDQTDIENNSATNIREMLRYEPGVEVGSSDRFGLTGFNIRGLSGNRVKILVDGVEQAKDFNSGGPYLRGTRNFVDIDSLKQVEVVKGPASSLYGSDALGGLVAFTTKDASDYLAPSGTGSDFYTSIKAGYNSVDHSFNETLTLANRHNTLESLLVYTRRDGEEYSNFDDGYEGGLGNDRTQRDPVDFSSDNLLLKLASQLNEHHRLSVTAEYQSTQSDTDLLSLEGPSYNPMFNYSDYRGDDTNTRKRIGLSHDINKSTALFDQLRWSLDWQESTTEQISYNHTNFAGYGRRKIDYSNDEQALQLSLQANKEFTHHLITYGAQYHANTLENSTDKYYLDGTRPDDIQRYTPTVDGVTWGLFLQDQIRLADGKLLLTPGIRYDNFTAKPETDSVYTTEFKDHESDKWTARIGGVYSVNDNYSLFAQISQGFKAPDLVQLYREDSASWYRGYVTIANPDLKPEKSNAYEIGFRAQDTWGNFEVAGFYNDYTDFINTKTDDIMFNGQTVSATQYQNIASATIKGIEARASLWLDQITSAPLGSSLQLSIAYADGEGKNKGDASDTPIDSVAPLKAVIGANYDAPEGSWGSAVNWTLVAGKDSSDIADETNATTAGFGILDINGYYNVNKQLTIRGGIYNLTNKEYALWEDIRGRSESTSYLDRYTQPGRNFTVSATYQF